MIRSYITRSFVMSLKSWTYTHIVVPGVPLASSVLASQADLQPSVHQQSVSRDSQLLSQRKRPVVRGNSSPPRACTINGGATNAMSSRSTRVLEVTQNTTASCQQGRANFSFMERKTRPEISQQAFEAS